MKRVWIIFSKEVVDNLRDRRTLTSSFLSSLFTPGLLLALIVVMGRILNVDPQEKPLLLPVAGAEYAPGLIQFLKQNNVNVLPAPADPVNSVREGDSEVVLIISPDYPEAFRRGEPAPVQLVLDSSRSTASASIQRMQILLTQYNRLLAALRLQARGVDSTLLSVVSIGVRDVATPQSQALIFLNMMPFLITLNIFAGGVYVIIDSTAGERERGSLEPLLINPPRRWEFVLGKLLASLPFAYVSLAVVLVLFWAGFQIIPVEEYIGFPMVLDGRALAWIYLLAIPEVLLASALQMLVATFTRSFKEAQTYLGFLPLIIGLPSMFLSFTTIKSEGVKMLVPTYGQSILINQILRGENYNPQHFLLVSVSTLLLAILLTLIAIRLYYREQVLFNK
ncbi:MAG TPA: ABC transporter permease [Anaerolinea thermolimosa]|uniref:ABC transporter permease n=1 Tax=Anaerolinea thermolimosa TaxID=229919 RepID=A0A3D1JG03_9CHLR|nr:ABC transporter permease [Anaerolinea thermolimosa]GAP08442.1 ABC-type Na+ efflux pump, permease component [Anaerolinea thermolimosa]HCE17384.1 ABC transporter permease [Anaerolinea thermolimosa]